MMANLMMEVIFKMDSAMKRTLFFMAMAIAAVTVTSCSKEEIQPSSTTGMTLIANVSELATKATISDDWKFSFETDDIVKVTNSTLSSGTYYTFTKGATNFTSTDAQTTSVAANWSAFFPGTSIDLTDQGGTMDNAADRFGYAGAQTGVAAGSKTLNITMSPKMSIIKVVNNKGSISLNAQTSAGNYITGMTASTDGPTFTVTTSTTASNLLSKTETGTYYIAVPSQTAFDIYDGTTQLKSIAADKLVAGNYYTLTVLPEGALSGVFTVDASGTKVHFSKGNMYYDGSAFKFEDNQYSSATEWQTNHVSHFYWSKTASVAYAEEYTDDSKSESDVFFTNATETTLKSDFTVNGAKGVWRTLSTGEWQYLLSTRGTGDTNFKYGVVVCGNANCLVIAPDGNKTSIASSYDATAWATAEANGFVCLPAAGYRGDSSVDCVGEGGFYWSSTALGEDYACDLLFFSSLVCSDYLNRNFGYSVRLVSAAQ